MKIGRLTGPDWLLLIAAAVAIAIFGYRQLEAPHRYASQREILLKRMKADPGQPWPRGVGHVVLAWPGSRLEQKGYLEPGGSFSPGPGTFGVLIQAGRFISSIIPMDQINQSMDEGLILGIKTDTPYYSADWSVESPSSFILKIEPHAGLPLNLLLRSDGPAGGPLTSVTSDGNGVRVNKIWRIEPADAQLHKLGPITVTGSGSWLQAIIPLNETRTIRVVQTTPVPDSPLFPAHEGLAPLRSLLQIDLPDPRFGASMRAQEDHLLMGLVRDETRPGDPVNYPLAWERDGAYVVVALARAGEVQVARKLAPYFAKHDFFGGFGPEADMPGQALWAIGETANVLHDPDFEKAVWPDVYRKAELIVRMLHTTEPIHAVAYGPIVPALLNNPDLTLVCEPARNGLIVGRMDLERPILYVNGVAYEGLRAAARIARSQPGGAAYADRWTKEADELRIAWWRAFNTEERKNERSAIIGLWPSNIAGDDPVRYSSLLAEQWNRTHDSSDNLKRRPLWTYFTIANAHEWLLEEAAGVPDAREHVWKTIDWFWANQTSPGLYTWWEGAGEENSFGLWQGIRGWVHPHYVTPHYWTAAEMLALQLDMLVHEDPQGNLIIGLGIPDSWVDHPMHVAGIECSRGTVSWNWDGHRMQVLVNGKPAPFVVGPAFQRVIGSQHQQAGRDGVTPETEIAHVP